MPTTTSGGSKRGFAAMDPAKQREIASKGGKASHGGGKAALRAHRASGTATVPLVMPSDGRYFVSVGASEANTSTIVPFSDPSSLPTTAGRTRRCLACLSTVRTTIRSRPTTTGSCACRVTKRTARTIRVR